jgi:FixJ family two-component response regulator
MTEIRLSNRERDFLDLLIDPKFVSNKAIADKLCVAEITVKGIYSRVQAALWWDRQKRVEA